MSKIEIVGGHEPIQRLKTSLYSLDRAFVNDRGEIGVPVGHGYEFFGSTGVGKSTFCISFAGLIAKHYQKGIVYCDLEGFDPTTLERILSFSDFEGKVQFTGNPKKVLSDGEHLQQSNELLRKDEFCVSILDSVAAIIPISEQESDLEEANMGRRGLLMAQYSRMSLKTFRDFRETQPKTILLVNHWYPRIGSRGYDTPGGEVKKYITTVRVLLRRKEEFPDNSYVLEGKLYKNRWGYEDRNFYVFMVAGRGLHKGLTAVWDCIVAEKASYSRGIVKLDGEESGTRLSALVKSAKLNEDVFSPYMEALQDEVLDQED